MLLHDKKMQISNATYIELVVSNHSIHRQWKQTCCQQ